MIQLGLVIKLDPETEAFLSAFIHEVIEAFRCKPTPPLKCKGRLYIARVSWRGLTVEGEITKMNLRDDQEVVVTLKAADASGAEASLTDISFASSDLGLTVTQDTANPATAKVRCNAGVVGRITASGKDLDGNVISGEGSVNGIAGDAKTLNLEFGTPTNIGPPA